MEAGVAVLNACGDLPDDDFWRDVVLAILELNALIWHSRGEDVHTDPVGELGRIGARLEYRGQLQLLGVERDLLLAGIDRLQIRDDCGVLDAELVDVHFVR